MSHNPNPMDLNIIVPKYIGMISYYAKKLARNDFEVDDLISEGLLGLMNAAKSFNSEKGSFASYVKVCAVNKMKTAVTCRKNKMISNAADYSALISNEFNPEDAIISREESAAIYKSMISVLSQMELNVLNLYLKNESYADISNRLGISVKSVDNALQRARKKIKKSVILNRF